MYNAYSISAQRDQLFAVGRFRDRF
jgi:hypothetical protein